MTRGDFYSDWAVKDLDIYYSSCVIGGPGAFMVPVNSWDQFPEAVRRKLVLELAGDTPTTQKADWLPSQTLPLILAQDKPQIDCLSGERIWQTADAGLGIEMSYAAINCLRSARSCCGERP